jgi:hypothetical protein
MTALLAESVGFALFTPTNLVHGLVWRDPDLVDTAVGPALEPAFGPAMYGHLAWSYLAIAAGLGVLSYLFLRYPTVYRKQTVLLIFGAIVPVSANMAFVSGLSWGPFPHTRPDVVQVRRHGCAGWNGVFSIRPAQTGSGGPPARAQRDG